MKKTAEIEMTIGSNNIFADLGFPPEEARNLKMRARLIMALDQFIEKEGLTQAQAAVRFKVTQPRISDLMRGRIDKFSLDALVNMLDNADLEVDMRIKARRAA